ncbi:aldo/keto reductase [Pendulispora brunnea]|uniref:Aldo/keto reductase n=1 Tax=Pendulispora brunnea TaxID=2905690 RepID=A0ABZ2K1P4_9BACT
MRKRALGKTGLFVAEMGIGTWGLSGDAYGPVEPADAERVLHRAIDVGMTLIDTADTYGGGKMEHLLGKALAPYKNKDLVLVTKGGTDRSTTPARKRFDGPYLVESVERSLKRLGRERLDVYLLHNPSVDALLAGEAFETLQKLKQDGKIGHYGIAAGDSEVAMTALDRGAEVISMSYNLLHSVDLHRVAGEIMVSGAGVLVHSTLAYGLLSGLWAHGHSFAEGDHREKRWEKHELAKRIDQLDALRFLVKGNVHSLRAAAIRFALANHLVSCAILGPRTVDQLVELVRETGGGPVYLPDADLAALPRTLAKVGIMM